MPGRFARYVVGMFLAAQRNEHLLAQQPQLDAAVRGTAGDGQPEPCDIAPARLFLAFANRDVVLTCDTVMTASFTPGGRTASGRVVPSQAEPTGLMRLAVYSPFAFTLVLEGEPPAGAGIEISEWMTYGHQDRVRRSGMNLAVPVFAHQLLPE